VRVWGRRIVVRGGNIGSCVLYCYSSGLLGVLGCKDYGVCEDILVYGLGCNERSCYGGCKSVVHLLLLISTAWVEMLYQ
jgi:hypothetical protein